jgi:hypothetical protein
MAVAATLSRNRFVRYAGARATVRGFAAANRKNGDMRRWKFFAIAVAAVFLLVPRSAASKGDPNGEFGPSAGGLALRIVSARSFDSTASSMPITIQVKNTGQKPLRVPLVWPATILSAHDANGKTVAYASPRCGEASAVSDFSVPQPVILPGAVRTEQRTAPLTCFVISKGRYYITALAVVKYTEAGSEAPLETSLQSNTMLVEITGHGTPAPAGPWGLAAPAIRVGVTMPARSFPRGSAIPYTVWLGNFSGDSIVIVWLEFTAESNAELYDGRGSIVRRNVPNKDLGRSSTHSYFFDGQIMDIRDDTIEHDWQLAPGTYTLAISFLVNAFPPREADKDITIRGLTASTTFTVTP